MRDLRLIPLVFDALGLRLSRREILDLLDRIDMIHEARNPHQSAEDLLGDESGD